MTRKQDPFTGLVIPSSCLIMLMPEETKRFSAILSRTKEYFMNCTQALGGRSANARPIRDEAACAFLGPNSSMYEADRFYTKKELLSSFFKESILFQGSVPS